MQASKQPGVLSLCRQQRHCPLVEGHEGFSPQPSAFKGDGAVHEVSTRIEHRQPGLDRGSIHFDVRSAEQRPNRVRRVGESESIHPAQHPYELTQTGHRV